MHERHPLLLTLVAERAVVVAVDERRLVGDLDPRRLQRRARRVEVGRAVGEAVAGGRCETGVLFCWTGTGASIAANKVSGVRAALCTDAATAAGARTWNDANVLVMGLRLTSPEVATEMLDAWFATGVDPDELDVIAGLEEPLG